MDCEDNWLRMRFYSCGLHHIRQSLWAVKSSDKTSFLMLSTYREETTNFSEDVKMKIHRKARFVKPVKTSREGVVATSRGSKSGHHLDSVRTAQF